MLEIDIFGMLSSNVLLVLLCLTLIAIIIWAYKKEKRGILWAILLPIIFAFAKYLRGDL